MMSIIYLEGPSKQQRIFLWAQNTQFLIHFQIIITTPCPLNLGHAFCLLPEHQCHPLQLQYQDDILT